MLNSRRMQTEELANEDTMDCQVWQNMPEHILQKNILPFVPLPDLCRFRAVSKKWNDLIPQPEFQQGMKCANMCLLLSAKVVNPANGSDNWEIQDVATDKHYMLNQDFLQNLPMVRKQFRRGFAHLSSRTTLAVDRGFMCVLFRSIRNNKVLCVVNPVTGSAQEVPCFPPEVGSADPVVTMHICEDHLSFKLFVEADGTSPAFYSFDSRVGRWCPKNRVPDCNGFVGAGYLQVFFDQHFNILHLWDDDHYQDEIFINLKGFDRPPPSDNRYPCALWSMPLHVEEDDLENEWMIPEPLESGGRIFLTVWADHDRIVVWEVDVPGGRLAFLAESSVEDAAPLVWPRGEDGKPDKEQHFRLDLDHHIDGGSPCNVLSMGTLDNRIIFASVTGAGVAFSLADHSWAALPSWKSFTDPERFVKKNVGLFGSAITLTLCPVPAVAKPRRRRRRACAAGASTSSSAV